MTEFHGRTLDRVPRWDDRNGLFRVSSRVSEIPNDFAMDRCTYLNQGNEGGCVGYSGATVLSNVDSSGENAHPEVSQGNAEWVYSGAKDFDEYPGRDYEGSSVLGSMQFLMAQGVLKSYHWMTTVDEIVTALATVGAVNFGINWYESMFNVDSNGLIKVSGSLAGGHAICASAYRNKGELIRLDNTWGQSWGRNGSAWISGEDVERLLSEQGECSTPQKVSPLPVLGTSGRVDPDPDAGGVVAPE